jgi:YhcG PDDEXK nuclease domain
VEQTGVGTPVQFRIVCADCAQPAPKVSPVVRQTHPESVSVFKDAYNLEFLALPAVHAEADLHRALLEKLRAFLIELGRDFRFIGSEYPLHQAPAELLIDTDRGAIFRP